MQFFQERIERQIVLYKKILEDWEDSKKPIIALNSTQYFHQILELFGPCLRQQEASVDLSLIYRASFHPSSRSLIVANQGVVFLAQAPFSKRNFILCQMSLAIYQPLNGLESVNIGIVGDIYNGELILRSESACPPSFLFGSQKCNCSYQWMSIKEIAAYLNPIELPAISDSEEFERWVEQQFYVSDKQCIPQKSGPGVLMIHLDSQSGMGAGWTKEEFCYDLFSRSLLRQLGENRVEQLKHLSMKQGYEALGLVADGRKEGNGAGYKLTPLILDFLETSKSLICFSNNREKLNYLVDRGYTCRRVKTLGQILQSGMREAKQRSQDFAHLDIGQQCVTFEEELARIKQELFASSENSLSA